MIAFDEALELAKAKFPDIDNYQEYDNVFVFGCSSDESFGGREPVAVRKDNGECIDYAYSIAEYPNDRLIREGFLI